MCNKIKIIMDEGFDKIDSWELAKRIYALNEIGSQEFKSSELVKQVLKSHGFKITDNLIGIPTAFRAEKVIGNGEPSVAFLAEYDALRGIGHACGHNLIAASAVFSAIRSTEKIRNGTIMVFGTPDEEGSGEWSGSKILMVDAGSFNGVDLVLGSHPGTSWTVGEKKLAVQDFEITFEGKAAHEAANPELGRSALDAAVLTMNAVNMMRQHVRRDANVVIHGIIREGGTASNVTPEKAVLLYGIRSSDLKYHEELISRFMKIVDGCSRATQTSFSVKKIGPLFTTHKPNMALSNEIRKLFIAKGIDCPTPEETYGKMPGGSTDFANVSQVVPALQIRFKIAPEGTPWHSRESLAAAISESAKKPLEITIEVLSDTVREYTENIELRKAIAKEFKEQK